MKKYNKEQAAIIRSQDRVTSKYNAFQVHMLCLMLEVQVLTNKTKLKFDTSLLDESLCPKGWIIERRSAE